ncbi:GyrI-like domain-containing protein [Paenibacillus sp. FSL R7-0652]|jgi:predicted transcriptional regulator YdeE|uniref:GyrI-like domain-containing protein n=1 Tax=Paenibacillus sp. AN1007 TaxID=3151385 RepID=A0AAU8NFE8_9BACL
MKRIHQTELVHKDNAVMIGLKWEGSFADAGAGEIRRVQTEFKHRLHEIRNVLHPEELLGLSYHMTDTGFVHYAAVEVDHKTLQSIPEGMIKFEVPSHTYAKCSHVKGHLVESSYNRIYTWIEEQGYHLSKGSLTHYEVYPMEQDPYDPEPEFTILVPINLK